MKNKILDEQLNESVKIIGEKSFRFVKRRIRDELKKYGHVDDQLFRVIISHLTLNSLINIDFNVINAINDLLKKCSGPPFDCKKFIELYLNSLSDVFNPNEK